MTDSPDAVRALAAILTEHGPLGAEDIAQRLRAGGQRLRVSRTLPGAPRACPQLVPAVEAQDKQLQEPAARIETQPQFAGKPAGASISPAGFDFARWDFERKCVRLATRYRLDTNDRPF
ncbi:hypothetical protein K3U94_03540 [Mycolicibacter heraklionensis]|uniref:Uncharacterized protein n=1 Tax=Mycolicibacter heraklionensis TaxID=512402 RepID=A0A9X7WIA0_9MYCO|nr:hypothetical protein K3U94_03540 [Mycolicibacter heraklionensis]